MPSEKPFHPLAPGSKGDKVKEMQQALIAKGYSCGAAGADGRFGDQTLKALEAFQDNSALKVQPLCDEKTWTALGFKEMS
jgi:peptidoglycan hydrolase-like protein with peptidoglycan-binding domain